ncbi:hypothetical protein Tco_1400468 [Tanacetum coccineum]
MATVGDLDEIEEVDANCILMANLQQASTSGTQLRYKWISKSDQGRSIEVPKIIIEAKNQEKEALEAVSRRTNLKTPF